MFCSLSALPIVISTTLIRFSSNAPNNGAAENCSGAAARVTLAAPRRPAAQPARHAPPPLRSL